MLKPEYRGEWAIVRLYEGEWHVVQAGLSEEYARMMACLMGELLDKDVFRAVAGSCLLEK